MHSAWNDVTDKRIALITGANKGIGFEAARQLATKGVTILLGSRDPNRGKQAVEQLITQGFSASMIILDVTDQTTIDKAVTHITDEYGRLDILINNGGVYPEEPRPCEVNIDELHHVFDVNFFGAFSVTKALLPLLRRSPAGRIVNVSSAMGSFHFHIVGETDYFHFAYSASKAALNMLTLQLSKDLKDTKIKVNAYTPGLTATEMTNYQGHSVEIGAAPCVFLSMLPDDGPTGKFFDHNCHEDQY